MNEHDGPPVMISDEWPQQSEPRRAAPDPESTVLTEPAADPGPFVEVAGGDGAAPDPDRSESDEGGPAVEPAAEPGSDPLATVAAELAALRAETVHLNRILDRLHAENERLRRGESEQILMPLFRDLMKLADDWTALGVSWEAKEAATPADVAQRCRDVADDAALILERHGVETFVPAVGDTVERKQHRMVGRVPAEKPELDNTVAEVRRAGFAYGDKIVKFAEVVVARHGR